MAAARTAAMNAFTLIPRLGEIKAMTQNLARMDVEWNRDFDS